jgi:branched-chain amino acid transport system substrate-binding protein
MRGKTMIRSCCRGHRRTHLALALAAAAVLAASCSSSKTSSSSKTTPTTAASASTTPPAGSSGSGTAGAPIVIGNIGSYTETANAIDTPGAAPIEAWADWVNAHGGINGHPVKLISMNDQGNQALAVSDADQLVNQDHVIAFVSMQDSPLYTGFEQMLDQKKIPVLGGNVYTPNWTTDPMFFPQGASFLGSVAAPISYMKKLGLTKIGIIGCSGAAQCTEEVSFLKSLADGAGLQMVYGANPSNDAPDYTANCLAAQSAGVQILDLGIATSTEGQTIAQDCARQNYHPDWIIPGEAIGPGYLTADFNNTFNFSLTQPWYSTAPVMNDFHSAMDQYTKINFNTVQEPLLAPDAWASGLMLQKAIQLSGVTGMPTSADILAGLQKFTNETLGGFIAPVTFTNPANKVGNCYFITEIQNGKFVQGNNGQPFCPTA